MSCFFPSQRLNHFYKKCTVFLPHESERKSWQANMEYFDYNKAKSSHTTPAANEARSARYWVISYVPACVGVGCVCLWLMGVVMSVFFEGEKNLIISSPQASTLRSLVKHGCWFNLVKQRHCENVQLRLCYEPFYLFECHRKLLT